MGVTAGTRLAAVPFWNWAGTRSRPWTTSGSDIFAQGCLGRFGIFGALPGTGAIASLGQIVKDRALSTRQCISVYVICLEKWGQGESAPGCRL